MNQHHFRIRPSAAIIRDGKVLLIECDDSNVGWHFNFPGGGLEPGEAIEAGLKREVLEETCADVEVGKIIHFFEHIAKPADWRIELNHSIMPLFECRLRNGSEPRMPNTPDLYQTGIRWARLEELLGMPILPGVSEQLVQALGQAHEVFVHHECVIE